MVSVIVPSYNHHKFLPQRLDTIFNQTFQDFEVILLDDCSTDGSWEFLQQFADHPKVSYCLRNESNSGSPFGMWKKGISMAKGELIWIAESDDVSSPEFLRTLVEKFEDPEVVIGHCRSNDLSNITGDVLLNSWWNTFEDKIWDEDFVFNGKWMMERFGRFKCPVINVSSAIFRVYVIDKVVFPNRYKYCGDWFFWGQVFIQGKVAYSATPLNFIRRHLGSATGRNNYKVKSGLIENTKIARFSSKMVGVEFNYDSGYDWLVLMWKKFIYRNPFEGICLSVFYLPFSFLKEIYIMSK